MVLRPTPAKLMFRKFLPLRITMTSVLTLDPTTLFFHTLCLSSQRHAASVENWRTTIETSLDSNTKAPRSTSTVPPPSLTLGSTHSSATSHSKRPVDDSIIDLCGPTPPPAKKHRTRAPITSTAVVNNVKITVNDDEFQEDDDRGGGLPDEYEVDGAEANAARMSPLKFGTRATSSVSGSCTMSFFHALLMFISKGLVGVKTEDTPQAANLLQQLPSQITLQPSLERKRSNSGRVKPFGIEDLPTGCNVNDAFTRISTPTYLLMVGHNKSPFSLPDSEDLAAMQTIFNNIYRSLQEYTIKIGPSCPVFTVVADCFVYSIL